MSEPMSDERLAEIAACSAAADRGPWDVIAGEKKSAYIESPNGEVLVHDERGMGHLHEEYVWISDVNAALIANAQTYLTELLAEVARLREAPTITDEMVERGAEACYLAREENPRFNPQWDEVCEEFPYVAALYRRDAHATLKAALENEKEK